MASSAGQVAAEGRTYVSAFAGRMTDNEWGDLFARWDEVEARDAFQFGGNVSREWPVWVLGHVGVELQAMRHFGEQDHVEFTVPVTVRTPRAPIYAIPSLAYGLGLSYATEESETEIRRTGSSSQLLAHWFIEVEFGTDASAWRPYARLHHRSDNAGMFDADTGSNAVLIGIRFDAAQLFR